MKKLWLIFLLFANLIIKLNCQDDDYDTEPEEAINGDYAAANEPEFFKNAFVEHTLPGSRASAGNVWGNYMQMMPFGPPPPYYPLTSAGSQSNYETTGRSNGFSNKPFNDDFFADFDKSAGGRSKDSNSFDESPPSYNRGPKSMSGGPYSGAAIAGGYNPMFNYGTLAGAYAHPYGQAGRFNPLQAGAPYRPAGSPMFGPNGQQRNKPNDNFDQELKEMGIDLSEFGLGGEVVEEEEKKKKGKEKKKRKEKPSKVRPLFPSFLSPIKTPTTTEAPPPVTQNQYLKSHVENDILNFGLPTMNEYGIKEHKLEKQVYGDRYQYPMQANQNIGPLSGYGQTSGQMGGQMGGQMSNQMGSPMGSPMNGQMGGQLGNSNAGYRDVTDANSELDFKGLNQQISQYSDNKINSLLKLNPAADHQTTSEMMPGMMAGINPLGASLPVFTAIDANPLNNLNANDIAAINLLESGITDLGSFSGKAHEYRTNEYHSMNGKGGAGNRGPPDNINENFKAFGQTGGSSKGAQPPKFLENDPFFKEKKPKKEEEGEEEDNDKYDSEPDKGRGRKVVYKLNSNVKSNKYFESVAPKSKSNGYGDGSSDDYEDGKEQEARSNGKEDDKYSQEEKEGKDEYSKEEEASKPKYSDDQSSNYQTTSAYSKEFGKPSTGAKYKFGYRYYGLNHQTGDNKKGDTMKLVAGKEGEESAGDKSDDKSGGSSDDADQNRVNGGAEDEKGDEKVDDKPTNEAEDSKDEANESTAKDDPSGGSHNSSSNANEENGSNEEEKVDEEFSGSKRYRRSVTTSDYFRPYRTNSKMPNGSLGRANDKSLKMSSISRMNDKVMASSCSYCNRRALKREDHLDHDFGDSEEAAGYPRSVHVNKRRAAAFERSRRLRRPVAPAERRNRIVSFDDPPDSYQQRNFDTAASHNEEEFDFSTGRRSPSRAGRTRNRKAFRSLKEEYDDAFGLKPVRSAGFELRSPRIERRKCSSNSARLKRTHRAYGGRDDADFYSRLWRNPMYKKYQYI